MSLAAIGKKILWRLAVRSAAVWSCRCFYALKREFVGWDAISIVSSICGPTEEECFPYSSGVDCKAMT